MKRSGCGFRLILFLFIGIGCIALSAILFAADALPKWAASSFGPPAANTDRIDLIIKSARLFLVQNDLIKPMDSNGQPIPFEVGEGEQVNVTALKLENSGLIRSASSFRLLLIYAGLDVGIQAGHYLLSPAQTPIEIGRMLQDATPKEVKFGILAGWRVEEIAAALPNSGLSITSEEFLNIVQHPNLIQLPDDLAQVKNLEGFLAPDVYQVKRDITAVELIQLMVNRFEGNISSEERKGIERQGLNLTEAVVLASLVQREAIVDNEKPIIASVFLNRYRSNMKLDSDPTVQYALGYNQVQKTWWTNPLSLDDLKIDSPYNTYVYQNLPPAPICNPGISAIQAVAFPAETPYLYFRAKCDGSGTHSFARDFQEHLQNACP